MLCQLIRSLDELFLVELELGYVLDFIEDGYLFISSVDSSFVCFVFVGKNGDEGVKRKLVLRGIYLEGKKKQRCGKVDLENFQFGNSKRDFGFKVCVVVGILGGFVVRVF